MKWEFWKSKTIWGIAVLFIGTIMNWWDSSDVTQKLPEILQLLGAATTAYGFRHAIEKKKT